MTKPQKTAKKNLSNTYSISIYAAANSHLLCKCETIILFFHWNIKYNIYTRNYSAPCCGIRFSWPDGSRGGHRYTVGNMGSIP